MHRPIIARGFVPALLTAAALAAFGSAASAQTFAKTGTPGNLPATAEVTTGVGPLTTITGTLTSTITGTERNVAQPSNPDLFEIYINDTSASLFSATTVGLPSTLYNPELFLFNSSGMGVYFNNDASYYSRQATIAPATALTPGLYYLGIGVFGAIPRSGTASTPASADIQNDIFPDPIDGANSGFNGLYGPTGGGGGSALTRWIITSSDVETGSYTIGLTGATYAAAPEPPQTVALGMGLLGLSALLLRACKRRTPA